MKKRHLPRRWVHGSIFYLLSSIFAPVCLAQNPAGPYETMPGITTGNPNAPSYGGTFTGNGAGLTNLTGLSLMNLPIGAPVPILALTGTEFLGNTNGTPVMKWPDISGNGNNFYAMGTNDYFENNSFPSVWSSGTYAGVAPPGGMVCTNFFRQYPTANTNNFTLMLITMNDPSAYNPSAGNFGAILFGAGNTAAIDDLQGYGYALAGSLPLGGGFFVTSGNGLQNENAWAMVDRQNKYHIYVINFSTPYLSIYQDGICTFNGAVAGPNYIGAISYLGATNNLVLFNRATTGIVPWIGWMAACYAWTNTFSQQQVATLSRSFAKQYDEQNRLLLLDGDSFVQANHGWDNGSESGLSLTAIAADLLPQWDVICSAVGGRDSLENLTNLQSYAYARRNSSGPNVVATDCGVVNDILYVNAPNGTSMTTSQAATQLPLSESNVIYQCQLLHSNNWRVVVMSLPSGFWETNGFKTSYNAWLSNSWEGFADGCWNIANTALGTNGACTNGVTFYSDHLHPNYAGIEIQATNLWQEIISTNW